MKKILISFILLLTCNAYGLGPAYKAAVRDHFNMLIYERPEIKYVWGAADPLGGKADCSGYIYWVFHDSGIPLTRTTAAEMRMGHGGWLGKDIPLDKADEADIIWWTWKDRPDRKDGHVGAFIIGQDSKLLEVTHASSSAGHVVHQPLKGVLLRDISAIRSLTFGDKEKLGKNVKKIK